MAEKNAKSKRDRKGESGASLLDKLTEAEAASVLRKLLDRHSELRAEAEAAARDMLAGISPLSVAGEIEDALLQFDYDDLNGRAGRRSCGYVEPSEAAGELLEEALDPFIDDMKRYLEAGLEEPACQFCQGILLGLYRVRGSENDILNWAPDFQARRLAMYWRFGARQAGPIAEARQQRDAAGSHPISYENMFRIGTGFSSPIPETDGCRLAKFSANRAAWRTSS